MRIRRLTLVSAVSALALAACGTTQQHELSLKVDPKQQAEFLADNGVDVVMLRTTSGKNKDSILLFMRQGFLPTARAEAEVAIARIRKIGELHPDFKKTNTSVFNNPYRAELNFGSK